MSSVTPRLNLPLLAAAQAQKHVTHNEALALLDDQLQAAVIDASRVTPPPTSNEGDCHLVATGATGPWAGKDGQMAIREGGAWRFVALPEGSRVAVLSSRTILMLIASQWQTQDLQGARFVGVNTAADATNRLAVASHSSLFNHAGNGHRLIINKATVAETGSVLFQTGFSGRGEVGFAGDDKLRIKVSANGSTWMTGLTIDPVTGHVGIGAEAPAGPLHLVRTSVNPLIERIDNTASGSGFEIRKARGAPGAPSATQSGDVVQSLYCSTYDGSAYVGCGNLRWVLDAAPTGGNAPTHIEFLAFATGTGLTEKARITSDGRLGVGTQSPTTRLDVAGPARVGQFAKAALPSAVTNGAGAMIYVNDEAGGAVIAFSDGTNWRRVTDRLVVS